MRFTASKEARNPHTDFICGIIYRLGIVIEERAEMSAQLFRDDILTQLLAQTVIVVLGDLNDAINVTVDVLLGTYSVFS